MKKIIMISLFYTFGSFVSMNGNASSIMYPSSASSANTAWKNLKVKDFILLSTNQFSQITGKKMNLRERISFSFMKVRMKHALKKNPNLTVSEYMASSGKIGAGWWILIGLAALIVILFGIFILAYAFGG